MRTPSDRDPGQFLTEDEVSSAVRGHLEKDGWIIKRWAVATAGERGDIVAERHGHYLIVEAKGEGSSKPHTRRYGLPFSSSQVTSHVSVAAYQAMRALSKGTEAAIALPDTQKHPAAFRAIHPAMSRLGISVYWVDRTGSVAITRADG